MKDYLNPVPKPFKEGVASLPLILLFHSKIKTYMLRISTQILSFAVKRESVNSGQLHGMAQDVPRSSAGSWSLQMGQARKPWEARGQECRVAVLVLNKVNLGHRSHRI